MDNFNNIVNLLKNEQERLTSQLRGIGAALAAFGEAYGNHQQGKTGRSHLSASARARIAAAQRARWAKARKAATPAPAKRTLSAAARKKIAAAQKARWARLKAGKKAA